MGRSAWISLSVVLCFLVLVFSGQDFFRRKKERTTADPDRFKQLAIEKPGKVALAPDFTLEDLAAKRWTLKDFGGKVVFLNFWATWCVPCREEMPLMEKLHREFRDQGLEVAAINFREDKKAVRKFYDELGLSYRALLDYEGKLSDEYGAWAIPLSYFINRKGEFIGKVTGERKWDSQEARAFFRDLLQEKN